METPSADHSACAVAKLCSILFPAPENHPFVGDNNREFLEELEVSSSAIETIKTSSALDLFDLDVF